MTFKLRIRFYFQFPTFQDAVNVAEPETAGGYVLGNAAVGVIVVSAAELLLLLLVLVRGRIGRVVWRCQSSREDWKEAKMR